MLREQADLGPYCLEYQREQMTKAVTGKKGVITYLTLCPSGKFILLFCRLLIFFQIQHFHKNSLRNTIRVPNSLDPDQAGHSIGPDLGPNCLQKLSAGDTRK